jgi:hypothetical protein
MARSSAVIVVVAPVLLLLFVACSSGSDNGGPTSPGNSELTLTNADVIVSGQSVAGGTFPQGHGEGSSTRFEAELMSDGQMAPGQMVWLEFDMPMGMGMMRHSDRVEIYDDGTHGDRIAGDGIYCLEDLAGNYGCHRADAEPGEYHYEFYGVHATEGHETNHMQVTVTITDP